MISRISLKRGSPVSETPRAKSQTEPTAHRSPLLSRISRTFEAGVPCDVAGLSNLARSAAWASQ